MPVGSNWEIVLIALVAIFLVLRLRSVLGRRTGNERPPARDPFQPPAPPQGEGTGWRQTGRDAPAPGNGNVLELPPRPAPPAPPQHGGPLSVAPTATAGVAAIRQADREFDPIAFLQGAREAFEMIVAAYARGDAAALRPLLDSGLYAGFEQSIRERQASRETQQTTIIGFDSCEMIEAQLREQRFARCTVRFVTEQINVTRNAEGLVSDGNPNEVTKVTDVWHFERDTRSGDPNWILVATSGD
jgi:predicted lipid-binding transport protein (Tim44 family)